MGDFKVSKTITKTAVPPLVVIAGGKAIQTGLSHIGVTLDDATCLMIASGILGAVAGLVNIVKNRWRSRK